MTPKVAEILVKFRADVVAADPRDVGHALSGPDELRGHTPTDNLLRKHDRP